MPSTLTEPQTAPAPAATATWKTWLPIAAFCLLWLDLFRLLSSQWEAREQYAYGWFVPFFAAALLWKRWADRPRPWRETTGQLSAGQPTTGQLTTGQLSPWSCGLVVLGLVLLLPFRVIYEINQDWPLISWVFSIIVVSATIYAFYLAGGRAWVRHFLFPVAFVLVAVVWPYRIEKGLTQGLMQVVTSLTVELLGWLDVPAVQRGNLIEIGNGVLGVEEACSGIRSFQSSLMAALLMGELYRLRFFPRLALLVSGIALGFCFNVVRTVLLSWQANREGLHAVDKWHDPAGMTITVACFFGLWGLGLILKKISSNKEKVPSCGGVKQTQDVSSPSNRIIPAQVKYFLGGVGVWAICIVIATEAWCRSHESAASDLFYWKAELPKSEPGFKSVELAPRTVSLLHADVSLTGEWETRDGLHWTAYFFRWQPRSVSSIIYGRAHRPDVCLPAAGLRLVADHGLSQVEAAGLKLPFRRYTYGSEDQNFYVFFCQWESGSTNQVGMQATKQADRLRSALVGRRHIGQQTFEVIIRNCESFETAETAFRRELKKMIVLDPEASQSAKPIRNQP
ncbi:MAG TPA: exosortase/archaeosortase family protein [Clostridia bacterium]|nr:exosortase/archaeosortase family protein [Clostridia bacterium]